MICRQDTVVLPTITSQVEARLNIILPLFYNCGKQKKIERAFQKRKKAYSSIEEMYCYQCLYRQVPYFAGMSSFFFEKPNAAFGSGRSLCQTEIQDRMLRYWIVFGCTVLIQVFILLHFSVHFFNILSLFFLSLVTHTHTQDGFIKTKGM